MVRLHNRYLLHQEDEPVVDWDKEIKEFLEDIEAEENMKNEKLKEKEEREKSLELMHYCFKGVGEKEESERNGRKEERKA